MEKFNLIFLYTGKLILSSKEYNSWMEIQDECDGYSGSIDFDSLENIKEYIITDYKLEKSFVDSLINKFIESKKISMPLDF